jgi:hypothetical protein
MGKLVQFIVAMICKWVMVTKQEKYRKIKIGGESNESLSLGVEGG